MATHLGVAMDKRQSLGKAAMAEKIADARSIIVPEEVVMDVIADGLLHRLVMTGGLADGVVVRDLMSR